MGRIQGLILLVLCMLLASCGETTMSIAIKTANGASEVGEASAVVLRETCTEEYQEIANDLGSKRVPIEEALARVEKLDHYCPTMRDAYRSLRAAHLALLAGVKAAQAGFAVPALIPLTVKVAEAMALISRVGVAP